MKNKCEVAGCDGAHKAKGLCVKHYYRCKRGGDPHTPSREELTLEERFRAKLGTQDPVTGCIEWLGFRTKKMGYGVIFRDGKNIKTHCLAWESKHGPIPEGMCVCHSCDNPPCCNEEHLYLGTHGDNMADRGSKGRQAKGEKNGRARLAAPDVLEIRRRLAYGETPSKIAPAFGVSLSTVKAIKARRSWSHLK